MRPTSWPPDRGRTSGSRGRPGPRVGPGTGPFDRSTCTERRTVSFDLPQWVVFASLPVIFTTASLPWFDESKLINKVTLDAFDPISKQIDFKKCAVKIIPV